MTWGDSGRMVGPPNHHPNTPHTPKGAGPPGGPSQVEVSKGRSGCAVASSVPLCLQEEGQGIGRILLRPGEHASRTPHSLAVHRLPAPITALWVVERAGSEASAPRRPCAPLLRSISVRDIAPVYFPVPGGSRHLNGNGTWKIRFTFHFPSAVTGFEAGLQNNQPLARAWPTPSPKPCTPSVHTSIIDGCMTKCTHVNHRRMHDRARAMRGQSSTYTRQRCRTEAAGQ